MGGLDYCRLAYDSRRGCDSFCVDAPKEALAIREEMLDEAHNSIRWSYKRFQYGESILAKASHICEKSRELSIDS